MKVENINEAADEARRFLRAVEACNERLDRDPYFARMHEIVGFKETAAVRRASLDLTKALARMRKP
jgi:hypothetical protein